MTSLVLWNWAAVAASIYCIVRGIVDLRQKHFAWGGSRRCYAAVFLLMPIQTHAVKIDLPVAAQR